MAEASKGSLKIAVNINVVKPEIIMSDSEVTENTEANEVPCILLPLVGSTVLLPAVTVAEMAPMAPVQDVPNTPVWFEGYYYWRNQKVPLISYENLNGRSRYPLNPLGRVIVINTTGINKNLPFVAISTQGIPKTVRVNETSIKPTDDATNAYCETMHVTVGLDDFVIPNIGIIESEISGLLNL